MRQIIRFDRSSRARHTVFAPGSALWLLILLATVSFAYVRVAGGQILALPEIGRSSDAEMTFGLCGPIRTSNCVIDGDTFKFGGESIRIADIDAPETHPSRCGREAALGASATHRLRELLSSGPFVLRTEGRDVDRYGRKLRIVTRDGQSLGAVLVSEGLAREWTGRRQPWCGSDLG